MTIYAASSLRILVLDNDPRDAQPVAHALQSAEPRCAVLVVESGAAFAQALDTFLPDVVLSDHAVPAFSAQEALRLTQTRRPECAFLVVASAFDQTTSDCLKAGAADFVRKSDLSRLLPAITEAVRLRIPLRKLSRRQREVLQLLARGYSTREISAQLQVSVKTVETHRAELMKRLDIRDLAGLVRYAISIGIVSADT